MPDVYKVKPGDTLSAVAQAHGVSVAELLALNPQIRTRHPPGDRRYLWLSAGEEIQIPDRKLSGRRVGDTCADCCDENCSAQEKDRRMRSEIVSGMQQLNTSDCNGSARFNYPHNAADNEFRMPPSHWDAKLPSRHGNGQSETLDYSLKSGVKPSAAIRGLFEGKDCPIVVECETAMYILYYRGILNTVGDARFDDMFAAGIKIRPGATGIRDYLDIKSSPDAGSLQQGDWVYCYNHPDYLQRHAATFGNAFQGENAVVTGPDRYAGFGVTERSGQEMKQELLDAYNRTPGSAWRGMLWPPATLDKIPGLTAPEGRPGAGTIYPVVSPKVSAIPCCVPAATGK